VAPAVGSPAGTVAFSVDGASVGSAPVTNGVATLAHTVSSGKTHQVTATYQGNVAYVASSGAATRRDPRLTASIKSAHHATKFHWYRSAVTVTFHCATEGSSLATSCPKAKKLSHNGGAQKLTRTLRATDGGVTTLIVRIKIDKTKPTVRIAGPKKDHVYTGAVPKAHCVGKDKLSHLASCRLNKSTHGDQTKITATAKDKAGNIRRTTLTYFVV
jgi:hypothetical protein